MPTVKIAEVTRGDVVESVHCGVVVVVDQSGKIIASAGNPSYLTYFRSAAKPLQVLPVVESGAVEHFGIELKEVALMAGSHSGEAEHCATTLRILQKIGLGPKSLQCGAHAPINSQSREALWTQGLQPTSLHCTCSGKHAGMLTLARCRGFSTIDYFQLGHPVQQEMLQTVAEMAGLASKQIAVGVDGCGVPVFALPLQKMAYAYARLALPDELGERRRKACLLVQKAMTTYPFMVSGTGRLDTDLLQTTGNKLLVKFGAEAVYCIGVPAKGWGIALKVADGNERALAPVVLSVLEQLGLLEKVEKDNLASYRRGRLKNNRGEIVGEIRAVVSLQ